MNSERKELMELINKLSHGIAELRYVKPHLKGGLRIMNTDAFHRIESKYKPKGLGKGIKYPFKL